jgi:hypothetical protein
MERCAATHRSLVEEHARAFVAAQAPRAVPAPAAPAPPAPLSISQEGMEQMLSTDCRPLPFSGERVLAVRLPAGSEPRAAAAAVAAALQQDARHMQRAAPTCCGRVLQLVGPECGLDEASAANRAQPIKPRHGWAGGWSDDQAGSARAALKPLCTTIIFLQPAEGLQDVLVQAAAAGDDEAAADDDAAAEARALRRVQGLLAAWQAVCAAARSMQLTAQQQQALLLTADTLAAVTDQLTLLPVADSAGRPSLALFGAALSLAAVRNSDASKAALAALGLTPTAAEAWQWVAQHVAPHATVLSKRGAAGLHASTPGLAGLRSADATWILDIAGAAPSILLRPGCELADVDPQPGAASLSFLHRFGSGAGNSGSFALAAVPSSRRGASITLQDEQVAEALQDSSCSLSCSPLPLRQTLASRAGCMLLLVQGPAAMSNDDLQHLLARLNSHSRRYGVVDVSCWYSNSALVSVLPSAGQWDALAQVIRTGLLAQRAQPQGGEDDDDALPAPDDGCPIDNSSWAALAASVATSAGVERLLQYLEALPPPAAAGHCGPDLQLFLARQGAATGGSGGSSGGVSGSSPTTISSSTVHVFARTSSRETGDALPRTLASQVAVCTSALAQVLATAAAAAAAATAGTSIRPSVKLWLEVCSVYTHRPADRLVLQEMMCAVKPGDAVLVASPERLARRDDDLRVIVSRLRERGTALLAAGVGQCAVLPIVLLDDGGQPVHVAAHNSGDSGGSVGGSGAAACDSEGAGDRRDSSSSSSNTAQLMGKVLPSVCQLLRTVCWATSAEHGAIAAQQGLMESVLKAAGPGVAACGAVSQLLSVLTASCKVTLFTRVSPDPPGQGGVTALAGGMAGGDMGGSSLVRQQGFCAAAMG